MKLLIALATVAGAAGLSGCVAYGGGTYGATDVYYSQGYAYPGYSTYGTYGTYSYPSYPVYTQPRGYRDRDRDGVPNRYDRDRDGDGVPNRRDSAPNNPRRN